MLCNMLCNIHFTHRLNSYPEIERYNGFIKSVHVLHQYKRNNAMQITKSPKSQEIYRNVIIVNAVIYIIVLKYLINIINCY